MNTLKPMLPKFKVEIIKLMKTKFIYISFIFYLLIAFNLVFQKVGNENSGVFDANLSHPYQIISLLLLVLILFSNILGLIIGTYFGASEYQFKTWSLLLNKYSINQIIHSKLVAIFITSISLHMIVICVGFSLGLFFYDTSGVSFGFAQLLLQIVISIFTLMATAIFGFFIAFMLKSVSLGNIIGLFILLISLFYGGVLPFVNYLSPQWYLTPIYAEFFGNLNNSPGLQIGSSNGIPMYMNISILAVGLIGFLLLTYKLGNKREY